MYPTKAERQHVAFLVIKKYPFLEDSIGTGIVSAQCLWLGNVVCSQYFLLF